MVDHGGRLADMMPNFIIIGAAKAGTTSLYHYLGQHPQVFMSPVKETNFFALEGKKLDFRGPRDMEFIGRFSITRLEDYKRLFIGSEDAVAVGEASPMYLYDQSAPARIHACLPDVKLIAVFRDPVERAFSQYLMFRRDGREPCPSFEKALELEPKRMKDGWEWAWAYRDVGFYGRQMKRYLALFPQRQILPLLYDDLAERPAEVLRRVFCFLGVDDKFIPDTTTRHNVSIVRRSYLVENFLQSQGRGKKVIRKILPRIALEKGYQIINSWNRYRPRLKPGLKERLMKSYVDDLRELESLLGIDVCHWYQPSM